ncbi:VOC family protein [Pseudomonas sp. LTJR-52]|uniref:VOC family protein n=1 Tax=Pseudomonas sp. LTJR-52 TaxID=2479392 RepID=UPI000EFC8471|nr:VOC family protein [Pseudomonas sp. LTJR-52]AYN92617.1 VOC family protein [Pseudomonas sp. LTJR-52]
MFSSEPITILRRSDHLRLVVPSLAESLNFWAVALGFTLIRQSKSPCDEALAGTQATAVAELEVHDYRVLLIEQPVPAHQLPEPEIPAVIPLLFQVHDLEARLVHIRKAGYEVPAPRIITQGPREGWQVVTIHGPDRVVLELMQPS